MYLHKHTHSDLVHGAVPLFGRRGVGAAQAQRGVGGPAQRRVQPRRRLAQRRQLAVDVLAVRRQARLRLRNTYTPYYLMTSME